MYVWEKLGGLVKDPSDSGPTLLLNISEEVGAWNDHGMLGFVLDPDFRVNGTSMCLMWWIDTTVKFRDTWLRPKREPI